jgi:hypothetical protein
LLIDHPILEDDLTFNILNGLGNEFHEIVTPVRAREKPLAFEELYDLLVGYDTCLFCFEIIT